MMLTRKLRSVRLKLKVLLHWQGPSQVRPLIQVYTSEGSLPVLSPSEQRSPPDKQQVLEQTVNILF